MMWLASRSLLCLVPTQQDPCCPRTMCAKPDLLSADNIFTSAKANRAASRVHHGAMCPDELGLLLMEDQFSSPELNPSSETALECLGDA